MRFFGQSRRLSGGKCPVKIHHLVSEYFEGPSVYYAVMEVPENQRMIVGKLVNMYPEQWIFMKLEFFLCFVYQPCPQFDLFQFPVTQVGRDNEKCSGGFAMVWLGIPSRTIK